MALTIHIRRRADGVSCVVGLVDDDNMFEWEILIIGCVLLAGMTTSAWRASYGWLIRCCFVYVDLLTPYSQHTIHLPRVAFL